MRAISKITALFLVTAILFGLASCGKKNKVPEGKTELKITYFNGGYGDEWIKQMKTAYEAYNPKVHITLTPYTGKTDPISQIEGGSVTHDLYFMNSTGMGLAASNLLVDLTDVYKSKAIGDDETVEEKMLSTYRDYFDLGDVEQVSGQYYAMPWATGYSGMMYNKTSLDKLFGEGGYSLPRTTDELEAFCDSIKEKNAWSFVWSKDVEYWTFMFNIWWAQYEGAQGYEDYFTGTVRDADGNPSLDLNADVLRQQGRLEAFELLETYMKKSNGYSHKNCDSMDFMAAQAAFFGRGYANDQSLCVFMINGDWTDSEMKLSAAKYNQDVRFMRAPVVSALGEKLGITEDELKAVIDYVDGVTSAEPAIDPKGTYTKAEVISAVSEARRMVYDLGRHHNAVIPEGAKQVELAKDFLKFFASDSASEIYVDVLEGLNLPYGYVPTNTTTFSTFVKSINEAYPDPIPVSYYKTTPLTFAGNLYTHADPFETNLFGGSMTAQDLFNNTITKYTVTRSWAEMLRVSGLTD